MAYPKAIDPLLVAAKFAVDSLPGDVPREVVGEILEGIEEGREGRVRGHLLSLLESFDGHRSSSSIDSAWWVEMSMRASAFPLLGSRASIEEAWHGAWVFDRRLGIHIALELLMERRWGGSGLWWSESDAPDPIAQRRLGISMPPVGISYERWQAKVALLIREWVRSGDPLVFQSALNEGRMPIDRGVFHSKMIDMLYFAREFGGRVFANILNDLPVLSDYVPSTEFAQAFARSCRALGTMQIVRCSAGLDPAYSADEQLEFDA